MRVQVSPNPQAELSPLPLSRAQNIYGQEALQMKQEQIGQMTRGASDFANVAIKAIDQHQEEEAAAAVGEAQSELSRRMDLARFGDGTDKNPGLYARKGMDAKTIEQDGMAIYAKNRDELAKNLPSERARKAFTSSMRREEEEQRHGFIAHREREIASYKQGQTNATLDTAINAAKDQRLSDGEAESRLIRARGMLGAAVAGQSPEEVEATQKKLGSAFARERILSAPDAEAAQAAQKRYGKMLDGEDIAAVQKHLDMRMYSERVKNDDNKVRDEVDRVMKDRDLGNADDVDKAVKELRKLPDANLARKAENKLLADWGVEAEIRSKKEKAAKDAAITQKLTGKEVDPEIQALMSAADREKLDLEKKEIAMKDKLKADEAKALGAEAKMTALPDDEFEKMPAEIARELYLELDKAGRQKFAERNAKIEAAKKKQEEEQDKHSKASDKEHEENLIDLAGLSDAQIKDKKTKAPDLNKLRDQIKLREVWRARIEKINESRPGRPLSEAEKIILRQGLLQKVPLADGTSVPAWKLSEPQRQQASTHIAKDDIELQNKLGLDPIQFQQMQDANGGHTLGQIERMVFGRSMEQQTDIELALERELRKAKEAAAAEHNKKELEKTREALKRGKFYSPAMPDPAAGQKSSGPYIIDKRPEPEAPPAPQPQGEPLIIADNPNMRDWIHIK